MIQLWTLASAVYCSSSMVPSRYCWLYGVNPMAGVIDGFRLGLTGTGQPPAAVVFASFGIVSILTLGRLLFSNRMEGNTADKV